MIPQNNHADRLRKRRLVKALRTGQARCDFCGSPIENVRAARVDVTRGRVYHCHCAIGSDPLISSYLFEEAA